MRFIIFGLLLLWPSLSLAEDINAGFVQGLWYSNPTPFASQPVRVYVAIRNNTDADLTGRVDFFDSDERFGRMNVTAINGRIVEAWADWIPSYGQHTISASLSRIQLEHVGSSTEAATVTAALAEDIIFVDYDTDGDGEGNRTDSDDDGDGISDFDEAKQGTDPLVFNKPKEDDEENESQKESNASDSPQTNDSEAPQGLEQFLTDNRAGSALSSLTDVIHVSKEKLDDYRVKRRIAQKPEVTPSEPTGTSSEETASETTTTNATSVEHIGAITRSSETPSRGAGIVFKNVVTSIGAALGFVFDLVLTGISIYLSHPILVQLSLLVLLLFLCLKLAHRFARRNQ